MTRSSETVRRPSAEAVPAQRAPGPDTIDVARRAYELFEARGSEPGADVDDWLQAERELRGAQGGDGAKS